MLLVGGPTEGIIQVADADQRLEHATSVAADHLLGARRKVPLPHAPPDRLNAAAVTRRRGGDIDQFVFGPHVCSSSLRCPEQDSITVAPSGTQV
ncbi:hypothetical protein [Isoptericola sp. BMS4]|uniref:hypothetical protein n=1 Tax=Isoptericola sp. BMS4 TaxID=2527875 RepID=UPI0014244B2C|nr:hypothetical protein [Isoptericola sp. BMS4]